MRAALAELRTVVPLPDAQRAFADHLVTEEFGSPQVVSRGHCIDTRGLPGLLANWAGRPGGILLYAPRQRAWEVVALACVIRRRGLASALLAAVTDRAQAANAERLWLVTTNNNRVAQACYAANGWQRVAVHRNALACSRRLKPGIPETDEQGVPIRDEWEYQAPLHRELRA